MKDYNITDYFTWYRVSIPYRFNESFACAILFKYVFRFNSL